MQQQISFCSPLKFQCYHRCLHHYHLLLPTENHFRRRGNVSSAQRISLISLPFLKIPNPARNSITSAAAKRRIWRRGRNGWQSGVEKALLQCVVSFVAWNLRVLPEPLDYLFLLSEGGCGGGLGFWKRGFGGGRGPARWKLGFVVLLLLVSIVLFLTLGEWCDEGDFVGFCRARFQMLLKRLRRRGRRRRRIWAF